MPGPEQGVFVDMCDAWVPQAVAERMIPLMLEAGARGTAPKAAALQIDRQLRESLGGDWTEGPAMIERGMRKLLAIQRMRAVATRLGPPLMRLIPAPVRPALARAHRPLARRLAATKYRRRYGGGFVPKIHPHDDLLHYSFDVARSEPAFRYLRAVQMYFEGGLWNVAEVERTLAEAGFPLSEARSLLEFACGYGRLTRHLVHIVERSRITVSDVDRIAVDFVRDEFGVKGFYSSLTPDGLSHHGRYEMIVVVSLFSHLPMRHWGPWLRCLGRMLEPDGVLLISALGAHAWNVNVPDGDRASFRGEADGFLYSEHNETRGRLSGAHYGLAYVTDEYVQRAVAENFDGRLLGSHPGALNGLQDAYVLQRERVPARSQL